MIVKNEEATLASCLQSVADLVAEMILVDTGSMDRTREIANRFGARVVDFNWVDSFAAARNESLHHAAGHWIFWLDGDESIDETNRSRLRGLFHQLGEENAAYVMKQRSISDLATGEATVFEHVRLFRNLPQVRWHYRVHEQILPDLERLGTVMRWTDVVIDHSGYEDSALHSRKQERNLELLKLQDAEYPNDSFTLFNLGLTYNALGQTADAMPYWRRSLERALPTSSWVRKVYTFLANGHRQLGQPVEALAVCRAGLNLYPDDAELLLLEAGLLTDRGNWTGAEASLLRLLQSPPATYFAAGLDVGLRSFKARHSLAVLYRAQNRAAEAETQWQMALAECPHYVPACFGLADFLQSQGRWQEMEHVLQPLQANPHIQPAIACRRAMKCAASDDYAGARKILSESIASHPRNLELHLMLSRVLLREGRDWTGAEKSLRKILELDPYHTEARNNWTVLLLQQGRTPDPIRSPLGEELLERAEKAFRSRNWQDAAAIYRPLLHGNFLPGLMLCRLAAIANAQGDFAAAWELHLKAIAMDPALAQRIEPPDSSHRHVICRQHYDLEEVRFCPVCEGSQQAPMMVINCLPFNHYHPAIHPVRRWVRCIECGHGFANPRPSAAALREAYLDPPPAHLLSWTYDRLTIWAEIVHELWKLRPGGDFLDVGVGNGALAGVAMDFGFRASGIDIHPAYADPVRRLGVEFCVGDFATFDFGGRKFDVIALGDVIEHLAEPRQVFSHVVSLLKPGGVIWLSTPNFEGVWTRSLREQDAMWMEGEHLQFFSLKSLQWLTRKFGLSLNDYRLSKRFVGCAEVIIREE
jgi:tetratricopeptide (TPR) repeat protein/2-polyprenyl-3-methyl-5-hydroxy-6-metoxy-1,4-benzoquinol methylase